MNEQLKKIIELIGTAGLKEAIKELQELSSKATDPSKKAVLAIVINAVALYGDKGIDIAKETIDKFFGGQEIPDTSLLSLEEASDLWAQIQNDEADHKEDVNRFVAITTSVVSKLFAEFVKGLLVV